MYKYFEIIEIVPIQEPLIDGVGEDYLPLSIRVILKDEKDIPELQAKFEPYFEGKKYIIRTIEHKSIKDKTDSKVIQLKEVS